MKKIITALLVGLAGPLGGGFVAVASERPKRAPVATTPVVLTDEDLERLPYGGPHKGM